MSILYFIVATRSLPEVSLHANTEDVAVAVDVKLCPTSTVIAAEAALVALALSFSLCVFFFSPLLFPLPVQCSFADVVTVAMTVDPTVNVRPDWTPGTLVDLLWKSAGWLSGSNGRLELQVEALPRPHQKRPSNDEQSKTSATPSLWVPRLVQIFMQENFLNDGSVQL